MKSIQFKSESLFKDRASKFYAYAYPFEKQDQLKTILDELKEKHPKARHFCYAFRLLINEEDYFITNDDGEPSNSAGAPILGQIKSFELHNVCIVVVRYFGGTKLGVSGLINAYKTAAKEAIEKNKIIVFSHLKQLHFSCDYKNLGAVVSFLKQNQIKYEVDQQASAHLIISIEKSKMDLVFSGLDRLGTFR